MKRGMLKQVQRDNFGLPFLIIAPLHPWLGWPTSASLTPDPRFWILIIIIPNAPVIPNSFKNLKINTMKRGMLKQVQHDNVEEISYIEPDY